MEKPKVKRGELQAPSRVGFVVLWGLIALVGFLIRGLFRATDPLSYLTQHQILIINTLLDLIPTLLSIHLIQRTFQRSMRGWLVYTMIGMLIMVLVFMRPWNWAWSFETNLFIVYLGMFVPILFQTLWLWSRVKKAWLWSALYIVGSLVFYGVSRVFQSDVVHYILPAFYGMLMYWFLTHPVEEEKSKRSNTNREASLQDRIQRLQDRVEESQHWSEDDLTQEQQGLS